MKIRILIALLALSLIFNIFFVAGAIQHKRLRPTDPVANITRVANELGLDKQQADRLKELRASYRADTEIIAMNYAKLVTQSALKWRQIRQMAAPFAHSCSASPPSLPNGEKLASNTLSTSSICSHPNNGTTWANACTRTTHEVHDKAIMILDPHLSVSTLMATARLTPPNEPRLNAPLNIAARNNRSGVKKCA